MALKSTNLDDVGFVEQRNDCCSVGSYPAAFRPLVAHGYRNNWPIGLTAGTVPSCSFVGMSVAKMSEFDVVESFRGNALPFRRQVSIRRDGKDFVVAFQPENIIAVRNTEANALRKMCHTLRWEIVSDTTPEPNDPASW
jgi:hypothetical protein